MASVFLDLPLKSVSSLVAPGIASEETLIDVRDLIVEMAASKQIIDKLFFDYSSMSVGPDDYVELVPVTPGLIDFITWFESGGYPMAVAIGPIGAEEDLFFVPPGGFNGQLPMPIPNGSRLSIKCLVQPLDDGGNPANVSVGNIVANFLK